MQLTNKNLQLWLDAKYNVLLKGKHGVGKTAVIKELFSEKFGKLGEGWLYFSASTMDPWVDFVGIPREGKTESGDRCLELIRPAALASGGIKAIFIDELNRAPKKVRNAVMELMQFKSINGHEFNNLEVVWGAVNPNDGNYDTENLDPAQVDRFEVQVDIPYQPNQAYFIKKYGNKVGSGAVRYWKDLGDEVKELVSPRRLDYAVDAHTKGIPVRGTILPVQANIGYFEKCISSNPEWLELEENYQKGNYSKLRKLVNDENFMSGCWEKLLVNPKMVEAIYKKSMNEETKERFIHENPDFGHLKFSCVLRGIDNFGKVKFSNKIKNDLSSLNVGTAGFYQRKITDLKLDQALENSDSKFNGPGLRNQKDLKDYIKADDKKNVANRIARVMDSSPEDALISLYILDGLAARDNTAAINTSKVTEIVTSAMAALYQNYMQQAVPVKLLQNHLIKFCPALLAKLDNEAYTGVLQVTKKTKK